MKDVINLQEFNQAVTAIYDSAIDASRWDTALIDSARYVGADAGQLVTISSDGFSTVEDHVVGLDNVKAKREFEELVGRGEQVRANWAMQNPNLRTLYDYQHSTERDMAASLFYQEHARPLRVDYYVSSILRPEGVAFSAIAFFRTRDRGHFTKKEIARVNALATHVEKAFMLRQQLARQSMVQTMERMLEVIRCAAMVFDSRMNVVAINERADEILVRGDGIRIQSGQLLVSDQDASHSIQTAMLETTSRSSEAPSPVQFAVKRSTDRGRYVVVVMPMRQLDCVHDRNVGLMLIVDPEDKHAPSIRLLRDYFGFSMAEAAIVCMLTQGMGSRDIAATRLCSVETVRSQIKMSLKKAGAKRQSELIAKVLAITHIDLVSP